MTKIQIISAPNEIGAGTRGASLGWNALRIFANTNNTESIESCEIIELPKYNQGLLFENRNGNAKGFEYIKKAFNDLSNVIKETVNSSKFPVIFSGDHSNAYGTMKGLNVLNPGVRRGVIWVDAHADLHTPYSTPSGNVHGMPLGMALGKKNHSSLDLEETGDYQLMDDSLVNPEDIVFIGLRDTETYEDELIKSKNIKVFPVEEISFKTIRKIAEDTLEYLDHVDEIYISFDIDSLDNTLVPGTGTPVPNGFNISEAEKLFEVLLPNPKVTCLEFTELNPLLDEKDQRTLKNTHCLFDYALKILNKK